MKHFYTLVLIIAMGAFVQAQTAGQEYFPYSFCTSSQSGCTNGIDGSGTYTSTAKFGASAATGAAYATPTTANGEAHTPNRMWKLFKKGNATSPQFVAFDFDVPPGVYTYSVYTRWAVEVDYNAETANKPFLKIMGKNNTDSADDVSFIDVVPTNSYGSTAADYVQTTGTVTIPAASDGTDLTVRLSIGKLGGSTASPTNLDELFFIDTASLTWQQPLSINELKSNQYTIYPNPANQFIMLDGINETAIVDVFNITGQRVKSFSVETNGEQMDISDLNPGVYFARVNDIKAIKFIKR